MTQALQTPLAVIGMACRLPGADDLEAYWRLLVEGRSALGPLPPERLDQSLYYDPQPGKRGKTYCCIGGVCSYRTFDPNCPLRDELCCQSDLAHVTGCEVAAEACRHAGWDPRRLPLRNVGVFIGHTRGSELGGDLVYGALVGQTSKWLREISEFAELEEGESIRQALVGQIRAGLPQRRAGGIPDASSHLAAGLIARAFDLTGPAIVLNAACSSSLLALAIARRALARGRIDAAIVGGTTYCKWDNLILYSQARSVSATGSRPFDADADGLIASDGYAILIVKTLDRALADGDRIQAVIRGIGISSDGRGKSLWAPRKEGQVLAIQRAYAGGLDASRLQYIEAHATSTQVGDATELNALAETLAPHMPPGVKIPVGSVKANIGHTLEAAGAASLIKTILALQCGLIPRQIGCRKLNPEFDWEHAPVFVPLENGPWPAAADGEPRRAAVNAFGIGGLNAHVVVDEYVPAPAAKWMAGVELRSTPVGQGLAALNPSHPRRIRIDTDSSEAVAIIGASCRFAGAHSLAAFADLLASSKSGTCLIPADRWHQEDLCELLGPEHCRGLPDQLRGGFITDFEYDWRQHKIPPVQVARANPLQFLVLAAVEEALRDAGCDLACSDRTKVGVVVGTQFASDFAHQLQMGMRLPEFQRDLDTELNRRGMPAERAARIVQRYPDVLLTHMPALLDESGSFSTSTLASRIAKTYDLMGGALALDAGESAAIAAITCATDDLLEGHTEVIICAAAQRMMDLVVYQQLALAGRLPDVVPGEGVGVLVLKRLTDAQRDGDRIRGILSGSGEFSHSQATTKVARAIGHTFGASGMASLLATLVTREGEAPVEPPGVAVVCAANHGEMATQSGQPQPCSEPEALAEPQMLTLAGTPYEMGLAHGRAHMADILRVLRCYADTVGQPWDRLPEIDEAAAQAEIFFGPDELAEMAGIAAGAGVAPAAIIAHNLRLYPDMGSGCVQFAIRGDATQPATLLHAANEDRPAGLMVRGLLVRTTQRRFPDRGVPYLTFGVAGEVGGINGINARGLAVTSSMLLDLPRRDETRLGRLHVVLVNRLLREARSMADALAIVHENRGTSAWGMCLSHHPTGELCYAEYDGSQVRTRAIKRSLAAANHSLLFDPVAAVPAHSQHRLARLEQLLSQSPDGTVSLAQAQAALRDRFDTARGRETRHPTMNTIRRVDNQISIVLQPAAGKAWVTRGPLAQGREDEYLELDLQRLFDIAATPKQPPTKPSAPRVCERYVLRTAPADRTPCPPRPIRGTAIIAGCNGVGAALAEEIHERGGRAVLLDLSRGQQQALQEVETLTEVGQPVHLFLVSPHDAEATAGTNHEHWQRRREQGVVLPFLICQRWYARLLAAGQLAKSSLTAVTALGGQFGFAGEPLVSAHGMSGLNWAESGALAGLVKAVWFETGMNGPGLAAKVIDLDPAQSPGELASYVLEELDRGQPDVEVGYAHGRRFVVRPRQADMLASATEPARGGVWIVTGGGRGVTAIVARELGRRFNLKLHLLGTSPLPQVDPAWRDLPPQGLRELKAQITREALAQKKVPAQAWQHLERAIEIDRNLRRMAQDGISATYHQCDVADRAALARTLAEIRVASGPIAGIVHGAGVELSCRFERKQLDMLEKTLAAKVDGAANLIDLTRGDPLRYFLAFGSISGRFGNFGQADYSLANEMLAKLVAGLRSERPEVRATTFQWHSWAEVGMAVRPESAFGKKQKNMRFMPPQEGVQHLVNELLAGLPESEVLITDPDYFRTFYS